MRGGDLSRGRAAALLLAALVLFSIPVGRRPLFNQDEARFALLAREAVESGHWLLPRIRGEIYLNKPPLFFWAVALLSWPFGAVTDATAPLASVLSALAALLAVVCTGRLLWGWKVGWVAGLVLATAPFFFFMSHQVFSDMMLTAWLSWALYFLLAARASPTPRWALVAFYLCVAGGLASKGPAALVAVVAALVIVLVEDGWRRGLRWLRLPLGLGLIALSTLPWLLPYLLQTERSYIGGVVVHHYGEWYFRHKTGSRLFELLANVVRFLPWALFLIPALWWWRHDRDGRRRPLLLWVVIVLVAVSLSGEQRARYFLPVLPPLAVLVAELLVRAPAEPSGRGRRILLVSLGGLLLIAVTGSALLLLSPLVDRLAGEGAIFVPGAGWERWTVSALAVAGTAAALVTLAARGSGTAAASAGALALGAILFIEGWTYPLRYAEWSNIRGFTAAMVERLPSGARVTAHPDAGLAYDFYLRRWLREVPTHDALRAFLETPGKDGVLLIREERWADFRDDIHASWRVLATGRVGRHRMLLVGPSR